MKTILFLCTGNYYRSRYAEELFNHRAPHRGLSWTAHSRGLALERGVSNIGPISRLALSALAERSLAARGGQRPPRQCAAADLDAATHIVALSELEHRPLMRERFPHWESRIEYWEVADVGITPPRIALDAIEDRIDVLMNRLRTLG